MTYWDMWLHILDNTLKLRSASFFIFYNVLCNSPAIFVSCLPHFIENVKTQEKDTEFPASFFFRNVKMPFYSAKFMDS